MSRRFGGADQAIDQLLSSIVYFRKVLDKLNEEEITKEAANLLYHIDIISSSSVFPSEQYRKGFQLLDEFSRLIYEAHSFTNDSLYPSVEEYLYKKYEEGKAYKTGIIYGVDFGVEVNILKIMLHAQLNDLNGFMGSVELLTNDPSLTIDTRYVAVQKISNLLLSRGWYNYAEKTLLSLAVFLASHNDNIDYFELIDHTNASIADAKWRYGRLNKEDACLQDAIKLYEGREPIGPYRGYGSIVTLIMKLAELSSDEDDKNSILLYAKQLCDEAPLEVSSSIKAELFALMGDYEKALDYVDDMYEPTIRLLWAENDIKNRKYEHAIHVLSQIDSSTFMAYPLLQSRYYRSLCQAYAYNNKPEEVLLLEDRALQSSIYDYLNQTKALSSSQRTYYFEKHYSKTLEFFSSIDWACGQNALNSYNAALFQKGILSRQQNAIKKNVYESDDEILKEAYDKYCGDIRSRNPHVERSEDICMQRYSLHPEFVDSFELPNWQDVQSRLGEKEAAIEFTIIKEGVTDKEYYAAILLQKESVYPMIIRLCDRGALEQLYMEDKNPFGFSRNLYEDRTKLYQLIWYPIEQFLKDMKVIYYAPYGYLNSINIEIAAKNKGSKSIAESYKIHRLSTTALIEVQKKERIETAAIFGNINYNLEIAPSADTQLAYSTVDEQNMAELYKIRGSHGEIWGPLDYSKLEIDDIYKTIHRGGIHATVYEGDNGTESSFKLLSGTASDIIHMATHGYYYSKEDAYYYDYFNDENLGKSSGVRSGLILAGGNHAWNGIISINGEDGILTADEISGMDLSGTKLLTLSACQTALGDIGSDGVYGMQRSFKIAGVNTIVMSLWKVHDEASYLMMDKLYEGIAKGLSCHDAFKSAQSFVRKWAENLVKEQKKEIERQYANLPDIKEKRLSELLPPEYYWAAFVMLD